MNNTTTTTNCPTCKTALNFDQLNVLRCYNEDCTECGLTAQVDQPIDAPKTRSIEDIKAELAQAEEIQAAEARAIREEEQRIESEQRKAELMVKNQKVIDGLRPHMVKIQEALAEMGICPEISEGVTRDWSSKLPSLDLTYGYAPEFTERHARSSSKWRQGAFLGYNITVGMIGEKKTFPPKKDGTYNYSGIATEISNRIAARKRDAEIEAIRLTKVNIGEEVATVLGGRIVQSGYDQRGRYVSKTPVVVLSVERAIRIKELMEAAGISLADNS